MATVICVKESLQKSYTINYENCITCLVNTIDDIIQNYRFVKKGITLTIVEDISLLQNWHWSEHYKYISSTITDQQELLNFVDFEKLYYVGAHSTGMLKDFNLKPLTSVIRLDDIFMSIYPKIRTLEKSEHFKSICDKTDFVLNSEIVEIPRYNRNKDKHTHTISLNVLLSQEMYDKMFSETNEKTIQDLSKSWIVNKILEMNT